MKWEKYNKSIFLILPFLLIGFCTSDIQRNIIINQYDDIENNIVDSTVYSSLSIDVKKFGAKGNGIKDDWEPIQSSLNKVRAHGGGTVFLPDGKYVVSRALRIYKNTRLKLSKNSTIVRNHNGTLIINGEINGEYTGYKGEGNILIEGGTFLMNTTSNPKPGSAFGIARADGVLIRNIKVLNIINSHAIDLNSSKNVVIENSHFLGFKDNTTDKSRTYSEAIQIANHTRRGFRTLGVYDGTPCINVTVYNCIFGSNDIEGFGAWGVGVGNHGLGVVELFNQNIKIIKNFFNGLSYSGIHFNNFNQVEISENTFDNCNHTIIIDTLSNTLTPEGSLSNIIQSGENVLISNNIFRNTIKENIEISGYSNEKSLVRVNSIKIIKNDFLQKNHKMAYEFSNININLGTKIIIEENHFIGTKNIHLINSRKFEIRNNLVSKF
ncbi:right-handed parallel beta-helix repeat-containing protein [Peribacillus sp. TH16]|uniref:glycosyl hydrolase family 28-related protein n=1 Tax=Peribacillus sp. TH16 TaxID=2798482 RepID=UPI0019119DB2|nr:glycosyl hydrolase family 28-related protein [Peribacillus sp. TH16]MBK5484893.1 right-handed parallel beta-helix repeat-containing protein [Peribacillus sp. TH16]